MMNILFSLASAQHHMPKDFPSAGMIVLYLLGITFFLALNAFFVASEFAIVKIRPSQLEAKAKNAKVAIHIVSHLDGYLSANQLGITISSLALGFLGEPFVTALVAPLLRMTGLQSENAIYYISLTIAYVAFTFLHVVIGELIPKSIAIRKSVPVTLWVASPLHAFYLAFSWVIAFFNGTANAVLKLCGIEPIQEGDHSHSAEELAVLVAQSEKSNEVTETEREILINALELNDIWVRDIMTPRKDVVVLDVEKTFEENLAIAKSSKHTRFPIVKGHLDEAIGLIHIKDLIKLINIPDPNLESIRRDIKYVPDSMPLDRLLRFFLKEHAHFAIVVDEFGTPSGLVFLDNVVEQLVGEIQDEFDNETLDDHEFTRISDDEFEVLGSVTLNDLAGYLPDFFIDSGEVSTIGGYLTQVMEGFPELGSSVKVMDYELTVESVEATRVGKIRFKRLGTGDDSDSKEDKDLAN